MHYDSIQDFFPDSPLTDAEKEEVVAWVRGLCDREKKLLQRIIEDVGLNVRYHYEEGGGEAGA